MKLTLKRTERTADYTAGELYIDGTLFCHTIEDADRGLTDAMTEEEVNAKKVYGETAIPAGTYSVLFTESPKFKTRSWSIFGGVVPVLANVKGFAGIRIHPANTARELLGCIAVGDPGPGCVKNSVPTWQRLMLQIYKPGQKVTIVII